MSLWDPDPSWLPGRPIMPVGGCRGWPLLLQGPDLGMVLPPLSGAPDTSIFLRSSLKDSSFFDGLSEEDNKTEEPVDHTSPMNPLFTIQRKINHLVHIIPY